MGVALVLLAVVRIWLQFCNCTHNYACGPPATSQTEGDSSGLESRCIKMSLSNKATMLFFTHMSREVWITSDW